MNKNKPRKTTQDEEPLKMKFYFVKKFQRLNNTYRNFQKKENSLGHESNTDISTS